MTNLFKTKLKKNNQKNIDHIYKNILKENKKFKKNNNLIVIKEKNTFIITRKSNVYIDKQNIYILEGIPTYESKKVNIKFFIQNKNSLNNLYDKKIYGSWKFTLVSKKNGCISIFQNILSHKPSYYFNNQNLFIYSSDLRSIKNSGLVNIKVNNKFKFLYIYNNYKSVYGRGISPLNKISQLKFNENLILKKKLKIYKIKKNYRNIYDFTNKENKNKLDIFQNIEKQIIYSSAIPNENNCISMSGGTHNTCFPLKKIISKKIK